MDSENTEPVQDYSSWSYYDMLRLYRFHPVGELPFIGGTPENDAFNKRWDELRKDIPQDQLARISKMVGWQKGIKI